MPNNDSSYLELDDKRVVLLLQGGGALGAYQVGAYRALEAACKQANNKVGWVGGISIGAVNAAVIAGPMDGDPATELKQLWDEILSPPFPPFDFGSLWQSLPPLLRPGWLASLAPKYADWTWMAFNPWGQPNFFGSRVLNPLQNPWVQEWTRPLAANELAFYDTEWLRRTLDKHVKWESINQDGATRLSLGAARVRDGEVVFFNSFASQNPAWGPKAIRADHVLASSALPPGFPGISIDGELYWDGGVSSNTPIEVLEEDLTADLTRDTIVFVIDVWDRKSAVPRSLDEVLWRQKCIQYGSRKEAAVSVVNTYELEAQKQAHQKGQQVPPPRLEVCQVMFERSPDDTTAQFSFADADFTRTTYEQMAKLGYEDMKCTIEHPHPVPGLDGEYAILYRHGTYGKHNETDGKYAAIRERKQRRLHASSQDEEHMNSFTLNPFTLTESSVADILSSNPSTNTPVLLVAIDYNWGPPVSGRFDVDFLQLWIAAKSEIGTKTVRLLGNYGPDHTWVDDLQFQHVRDCGERQLYLIVQQGPIGRGPDPLPTEFVIKLQTADGQVYYDNNNGSNYRLKPYLGRSTSAVAGPDAIWIFDDFVNYRLLKHN